MNKDKVRRQRAVTVLCLASLAVALLVYWQLRIVGIAMTDEACCGRIEHVHGESCVAERTLRCGEEHVHTDGCYETVWSCGLQEHVHTLACYSDRTADVETSEMWESTLPVLSGHPTADLVRIAESQKGYTESARNVEFTERGDGGYEDHGYTRYGEFVGHPYCDNWSAPFVSFCLHYASVPESAAPRNTGCNTMKQLWENAGTFFTPEEHGAQPGDLVFLDRDGNGSADSVGIVTFANAKYVRAIEGNSNEKVEENRIPTAEGTILGYGVPAVRGTPFKASDETSASSWMTFAKRSVKKQPARLGVPLRSTATGDVALDDYITEVTGLGTVRIDENLYSTLLQFSFTMDPQIVKDVTDGGYKFFFDLPEEVLLPSPLINNGPYYAYKLNSNPLELAFTYDFVQNPDGTYRLELTYDEDYVDAALESGSDQIDNVLRFRCFIDTSEGDGEDGINVSFTVDETLYIPPDKISEDYDVSTQKTGSFTSDGKLRYEVTVSSSNGTPSTVEISDTFTYSGDGTIVAPTSVSVVHHYVDGTVSAFDIPAEDCITSSVQNEYDMTLSLPHLGHDEYYTIVYEYTVSDLTDENASVSAYNRIEATSDDGHESTSDSSEYSIYNQQRKKIGKDGIPYGDYVQWVISVNDRGSDIAGKVVYDDSFSDARNELINGTNGIVVQNGWAAAVPGVDYEFVYDGGGNVIGVRFLPADASTPNTNTYHITYYTYPDAAYGETVTEHNDVEFDGENASYDVVIDGGGFEKTANGNESIGGDLHAMDWTVTVRIPTGGIQSGTVFTDTLSPSGHYMTQAQFDALVAALEDAWETVLTVTPVYTDGNITGYTFKVGADGGGYLFANGYVDEIIWQYQTTGDMTGKVTEHFVNTFSDGEKTLPVDNVVSPNVKKLNARRISDWQVVFSEEPASLSLNHDDEDNTFVWIAQITPGAGLTEYHVTDLLPEGVELIGVKVIPSPLTAYNYGMNDFTDYNLTIGPDGTISGEIGQLWFTKTVASGAVATAADGRQSVDITLTANSAGSDLFASTFNLIYYCQLAEDVWPENGTVRLELNNTLSVQADGDDYGEAENTIVVDATNLKDVVDKHGVWDKNTHMIFYTVDINPDAENLVVNDTGTIDPEWMVFTDVLSYPSTVGSGTVEAILNLSSVVLETEEDGVWTPLENVQWSARTVTDPEDPNIRNALIVMRVPDGAHLRLTYSYQINSSATQGITFKNSAILEGKEDGHDEHDHYIDGDDFETSAESDYKEFVLIKIDEDSGKPLANAVFTVYRWDAVNDEWIATEKTYTTDAAGKIVIKVGDKYPGGGHVYDKDTAYCIMETSAPPGYMLPENPRRFYFWFSENVSAPPDCPDDYMLTAANISTSSHRIEEGNMCLPSAELPVTGSRGTVICTIGGLSLMAVSLIYGFAHKRKRKRGCG